MTSLTAPSKRQKMRRTPCFGNAEIDPLPTGGLEQMTPRKRTRKLTLVLVEAGALREVRPADDRGEPGSVREAKSGAGPDMRLLSQPIFRLTASTATKVLC